MRVSLRYPYAQMQPRILLLATALFGLLPMFLAHVQPGPGRASQAVQELEFVVERADGSFVDAHFLVAAGGDDALAAATAAAHQLFPGSELYASAGDSEPVPGAVTAQWAPWGWRWDSAELPATVTYNPSGNPTSFTAADVAAVLDIWSSVPTSSFAFAYAGLTGSPASMSSTGADGQNVIAWADLGCASGCVLGVTTKSFSSHEADIVLNSNTGARLGDGTGGTFDVFSVLLHEAGHLAGLEHSCPVFGPCTPGERDAVMFFSYDGIQRALAEDDVDGLSLLYPENQDDGSAGIIEAAPREPMPALDPAPVSVKLSAGWNFVVLPAGPIDGIIGELSCVEAVYGLGSDGWAAWVRGVSSRLQTLTSTQPGQPYWVTATGSCSASFH
jgi:hypothetical protein